jgi:hypothetical protein
MTLKDQLLKQITKQGDCWIWSGQANGLGLGIVKLNGKIKLVHKVLYRQDNGKIPAYHRLSRVCPTHACCNPAHQEPYLPRRK